MADLFGDNPPTSLFGAGTTAVGELFRDEEEKPGDISLFAPPEPKKQQEPVKGEDLPTLSFSAPVAQKKEEPKKENRENKQQKEQKPPEKKKKTEKKRVQKFVVQKKEQAPPPDPVKKALAHFQSTFNTQFDALMQVIDSLKPPDEVQGAVLPKDQILRQIQDAVEFADERDGELLSKQILIDRIDSGEFENDERKVLREKVADLKKQIDAETKETQKVEQKINQLLEEIAYLTNEIEQFGPNSQNSETRLRNAIKRDIERANLEFQNYKKSTEKAIADQADQVVIFNEQKEKLEEQNLIWRDYPFKTEEDLAKGKADFKEKVKKIINDMVDGVVDMIDKNLKSNRDYSGDVVINAMKMALRETGESLIESDDSDSY